MSRLLSPKSSKQDLRSALGEASKEQLLDLYRKRGNLRHKRLQQAVQAETTDRQFQAVRDHLVEEKQTTHDLKKEFEKKLLEYDVQIDILHIKNKEIQKLISQHKHESETYLHKIQIPERECARIIQEITPSVLRNLNTILTNESPESLVRMLEHMVALMRNTSSATNIDVELYLKDYQKLMLKLAKLDPLSLTIDNVMYHRDELYKLRDNFTQPTSPDFFTNRNFVSFLAWSQQFSEVAVKRLCAEFSKKEITKLEAESYKNEQMIHQNEIVKKQHGDTADMYYDEKASSISSKIDAIYNLQNQEQNLARDQKLLLEQFEQKYFERIRISIGHERDARKAAHAHLSRPSRASKIQI